MMRKKNRRINGMPAAIGVGSLVGILVLTLAAVITAILIAAEKIGEGQAVYGAAVALLVGSFAGAFFAARIAGEKRIIVSLIDGVAFYVLLLCVNALFFDGMYKNIWVTALLVLGGSTAAGLIGAQGRSASYKGRRRKIRIP